MPTVEVALVNIEQPLLCGLKHRGLFGVGSGSQLIEMLCERLGFCPQTVGRSQRSPFAQGSSNELKFFTVSHVV